MIRRSALAVFLFLLVPAFAFGGDPMDVDDVLQLLEAGISERVIVAQIEASGSDFDLSTDEIVSLQEQGVGERIIEAMIRSGSEAAIGEGEEALEEQDDPTVVVPAHLGFARYDHAGYVDIRLVPWSVPNFSYVYVGYDPWYWDPFWWDTPYYVSYRTYPYVYWGWGAGPWYYRPYGWYARNCFWPRHHDHYYASTHYYYNHPSSHDGVASRSGTWKKKSLDRGSSVSTASATRTYRSGSKTAVRSPSGTTSRTTYRSPQATTRKSTVGRTTTTRYRSDSKGTIAPRAPTRSSERAAPRSGSRSISRPSSGGSSGAARAAPSRGGSASSSGGRKSKGR